MTEANRDQADYWNSPSGRVWVEQERAMDALLAPVLDAVFAAAALLPGQRVLDIGCGTGISTILAAARVTPGGEVTGADISTVMIDRARQRASEAGVANAVFAVTDAQTHPFPEGGFDRVISRFGVMFFGDPAAAFANIARALKPGGRIAFAAWSVPQKNPWFAIPAAAATERLGASDPSDPHAPGPFAFADAGRVGGILAVAGLAEVTTTERALLLAQPGAADDAARLAMSVGPAVRIMAEKGGQAADAAAIKSVIAGRFAAFATPGGVRIPAAVHIVTARRG